MNLFSAAERLAAIDRSAVRLDPGRCLHTLDRFSTCTACYALCPLEAIRPGKPPALEAEACANCLGCLPACPAGAFTADDSVPALLNCAARLETAPGASHLELACEPHPEPGLGPAGPATAVQVRGCLAGLGAGAYLALLALGMARVTARLELCAECRLEPLQVQVRAQVADARRLASAWGLADALQILETSAAPDWTERPVWNAHNPPLSRRDLFRMASHQGQTAAARAMAGMGETHEKRPPRARARLQSALDGLQSQAGFQPHPPQADPNLEGLGFATLTVSDDCTACAACARVCPTGALAFEKTETGDVFGYTLSFSASACTACGACAHACAPGALSLDPAPSFAGVFGDSQPRTLQSGPLVRCTRCNALFPARLSQRLCPACEFRAKNPFGTRDPRTGPRP